jgi:2-dehydropantoate 2-reductase
VRHGVLGAGGVGCFIGGALARAGHDVVLLMRPSSYAAYDGRLRVESVVLGGFEVDLPAAVALDRDVDVLWVTPKATQLDAALELVGPGQAEGATLVPLLNGLDHVALLRSRFGEESVLPGVIYVESERVGVGRVSQTSAFGFVELAPHPLADALCTELDDASVACSVGASEAAVLLRKLATLGPVALTTTALGEPLSSVVGDPLWRSRLERCMREVAAIAAAEDVDFDVEGTLAACERAGAMRSSMQKDRAAGRPLELDAIGGAILRAAGRYGLDAPATQELVDLIATETATPQPARHG